MEYFGKGAVGEPRRNAKRSVLSFSVMVRPSSALRNACDRRYILPRASCVASIFMLAILPAQAEDIINQHRSARERQQPCRPFAE